MGSVRTERYANGESIDVFILDEDQMKRVEAITDRYCDSAFDGMTDTTLDRTTEWTQTFGRAKHTSVRVARGDDRAKLLGTYQAPPKKEPTSAEIEKMFLTGAERGTASTVARWISHFKDKPNVMWLAWNQIAKSIASGKGDPNALGVLVENGMDPNTPIEMVRPKTSALILVTHDTSRSQSRPQLVKTLLDHGADPNFKNNGTALSQAAQCGDTRIAKLLLARRAQVNAVDNRGNNALHEATRKDHGDMVDLLLAKGANPNARTSDGETPLFEALNCGIAEALLAAGADPAIQNNKGQTADEQRWASGQYRMPDDVRATIRQRRLGKLAQDVRPPESDLADPDEVRARRSRGRSM
ncbi:hypothetical protein CSC65_05770 [Pseudoxanthomonas daejeonensis]|uniref:Uncharacterized protein n=1 Tax=Pseudoxanthomonas daejeonensis TaxID=266062 RepID=A0ABQ6ZA49_9GAMM|nr:hypothetical protein CSC65_05770 [Pseudoxanthomonas daejeonensis]